MQTVWKCTHGEECDNTSELKKQIILLCTVYTQWSTLQTVKREQRSVIIHMVRMINCNKLPTFRITTNLKLLQKEVNTSIVTMI